MSDKKKTIFKAKKTHSTVFGTDSDQNGMLEEIPRSGTDSCSWLSHLGVRAPNATRRKRRYEANQVWLNTTFISQGSHSWGKLAVETWRVKTELIIITILHIIIITTSILNLGFKTIAPKILAHKNCTNKHWKYPQIFAAIKTKQNLLQKLGKTYCKNHQVLALA
jgi:hypothetical protein